MNTLRASDPTLNQLAVELKTLEWLEPLTVDELNQCHELTVPVADPAAPGGYYTPKRKLVSPLPGCFAWHVRMYLAGEQRTLGITDHANAWAAFRFADMAQQHFWKYKVRCAHPPTESDLNLSPERMASDMASEPNAISLLRRIEEYLLKAGVLRTSEQRRKEKAEKRARERGGLRTMGSINHMEVIERFDGMCELQGATNSSVSALVAQVQRLQADVNMLRAQLAPVTTYPQPGWPLPAAPGWPTPPPPGYTVVTCSTAPTPAS